MSSRGSRPACDVAYSCRQRQSCVTSCDCEGSVSGSQEKNNAGTEDQVGHATLSFVQESRHMTIHTRAMWRSLEHLDRDNVISVGIHLLKDIICLCTCTTSISSVMLGTWELNSISAKGRLACVLHGRHAPASLCSLLPARSGFFTNCRAVDKDHAM